MSKQENNKENVFFIPIEVESLVVEKEHGVEIHSGAGQLVDFSMLPHANKGENCSLPRLAPNISEDLVSKPFEATNDPLEPGIHLHWTLPKEFRRARITDNKRGEDGKPETKYREIPNRWLIERRVNEKRIQNGAPNPELDLITDFRWHGGQSGAVGKTRRWVLEVDAVSKVREKSSCAYPLKTEDDFNEGLPNHGYLGKVYLFEDYGKPTNEVEKYRIELIAHQDKVSDLRIRKSELHKTKPSLEPDQAEESEREEVQQAWDEYYRLSGKFVDEEKDLAENEPVDPRPSYLDSLTVFGYGDPLYAAYYPQSRNVFGFHDDMVFQDEGKEKSFLNPNDLDDQKEYEFRYVITGWYEEPKKDPMATMDFKVWKAPGSVGLAGSKVLDKSKPFARALEVVKKLDNGEDFAQLALTYSDEPASKDKGGRFEFTQGQVVPAFEKAVLALEPGTFTSTPVETQFGFFIVRLEEATETKDENGEPNKNFVVSMILISTNIDDSEAAKEYDVRAWQKHVDHSDRPSSIVKNLPSQPHLYGFIPEQKSKGVESVESFNWFIGKNKWNIDNDAGITDWPGYFRSCDQKEWDESFETLGRNDILRQLQENEGEYIFEDESGNDELRGRSILMGRIRNVKWGKIEQSTFDATLTKEDRVVLANTPGQALAALIGASAGDEEGARIEMFLDALQLGLYGQESKQDFPALLEEGLHASGFAGVPGESIWEIGSDNSDSGDIGANTDSAANIEVKIPAELKTLLKELNRLQKDFDHLSFKIGERQKLLYADWYKYMVMEYDLTLGKITIESQVNEVREFLSKSLRDFKGLLTKRNSIESDLTKKKEEVESKINSLNTEASMSGKEFRLKIQQGPRYYVPREPVLLFNGPSVPARGVSSSERLFVSWERLELGRLPHVAIERLIGNLFEGNDFWGFDFADGNENVFKPLFMDWEVEIFPFTKQLDRDFHQRDWRWDTIVKHYEIPDQGIDLNLKSKYQPAKSGGAESKTPFEKWSENHPRSKTHDGVRFQSIEGRSLLTPDAHRPLIENLESLLEQVREVGGETHLADLKELIQKIEGMPLLSQSLSGFNDALIMRKQILQLKVKDPLAQTDILQKFTQELADAIGNANEYSPLPSNLFLPLREGAFRIRRIRLVDKWGRVRKHDLANLAAKPAKRPQMIIADSLRPPATVEPRFPGMAYCSPRVVQPARLNFRWKSAEIYEKSTNVIRDVANPVCGFIVPNFLDQSLMIYDAQGKGLAVLARSGNVVKRLQFPGSALFDYIPDQTLYRFVSFFEKAGKNGPDVLVNILNAAQSSMAETLPENFAQFDGMAMLVGRPLALLRAEVSVELRGEPVINQSWESRQAVYQDSESVASPTMGFDKVRFLIRLGEKFKKGDGLMAYYLDADSVDSPIDFYSQYVAEEISGEKARGDLEFYLKERESLDYELDLESRRLEMRKFELKALTGIKEFEDRRKSLEQEINFHKQEIKFIEARKQDLLKHEKPGVYSSHSDFFALSPRDKPRKVCILMDPRAKVHVTAGIVPVKEVDIPSEYYADALNNIQIAFLTTPVISPSPDFLSTNKDAVKSESELFDRQKFWVVSPDQPGFHWSWIQKLSSTTMSEIPANEITQPPTAVKTDFGPQSVFEGWMRLTEDSRERNDDGNTTKS